MHASMQKVAPLINQTHRGGTLRLAFLSAVVSLVVSFAAAAAPICLRLMRGVIRERTRRRGFRLLANELARRESLDLTCGIGS
jgi:hypothetical protein